MADPPKRRRRTRPPGEPAAPPASPPRPGLQARLRAAGVSLLKDALFLGVVAGLALWGLNHTAWGSALIAQAWGRLTGVDVAKTGGGPPRHHPRPRATEAGVGQATAPSSAASEGPPELLVPLAPGSLSGGNWSDLNGLRGRTFQVGGLQVQITEVEVPYRSGQREVPGVTRGRVVATVREQVRGQAGAIGIYELRASLVRAGSPPCLAQYSYGDPPRGAKDADGIADVMMTFEAPTTALFDSLRFSKGRRGSDDAP